jgi:hypothetical protein
MRWAVALAHHDGHQVDSHLVEQPQVEALMDIFALGIFTT